MMPCAVGGVLRASRGEVFCARVPAGTAGRMAVPEDTGRLRTEGRATGRHIDRCLSTTPGCAGSPLTGSRAFWAA